MLQARGYRYGEPDGIERERSLIIDKILTMLQTEGISLAVISKQLNIPIDELSSLLFGFVIISGGGNTSSHSSPFLKLV